MRKFIVATCLVLSSIASYAQSSSWTLTEVTDSVEPVGYIYHVYARGVATIGTTNSMVAAGLRFVCSAKDKSETAPIIAIYWDSVLMVNTSQEVTITVDNLALLKEQWTHEGPLIYSSVVNEPALLSAIKRGRTIKFNWNGNDNSKYVVVFNLKDFNLSKFNTSCKTNI